MADVKLCKDCRWADNDDSGRTELCQHSLCLDLVSGRSRVYCSDMRHEHCRCGPEGKLWEPKE